MNRLEKSMALIIVIIVILAARPFCLLCHTPLDPWMLDKPLFSSPFSYNNGLVWLTSIPLKPFAPHLFELWHTASQPLRKILYLGSAHIPASYLVCCAMLVCILPSSQIHFSCFFLLSISSKLSHNLLCWYYQSSQKKLTLIPGPTVISALLYSHIWPTFKILFPLHAHVIFPCQNSSIFILHIYLLDTFSLSSPPVWTFFYSSVLSLLYLS